MQKKKLSATHKGFLTKDLFKTWEEIKTPAGTKTPKNQILVTRQLLREYRLGVFSVLKRHRGIERKS
ncbi:MAG: hypothetical protein BA871_11610 [Desulfuromonadales bacterium C00003096]|nr:MAG: hypothetical protein BA871_11610 [Desulfuromonadales bacterium C00003096]